MAVDTELDKRFYRAIGVRKGVEEKNMMGGHCFMLNGNMIGGADRDAKTGYGRFMFRVGKENETKALAFPEASKVVQGGRSMGGLISVDADACNDSNLKALGKLALGFVKDMPAK